MIFYSANYFNTNRYTEMTTDVGYILDRMVLSENNLTWMHTIDKMHS